MPVCVDRAADALCWEKTASFRPHELFCTTCCSASVESKAGFGLLDKTG